MEERAAVRKGPRKTYKPENELSKKERMQKAEEEAKEYEVKMERAWGQFGRIQDRMKAREAKRKKKPSAYAEKKMEINREEEVKKVYVNQIRAVFRKHAKDKLKNLNTLKKKYEDDLPGLYEKICKKYGVTPKSAEELESYVQASLDSK